MLSLSLLLSPSDEGNIESFFKKLTRNLRQPSHPTLQSKRYNKYMHMECENVTRKRLAVRTKNSHHWQRACTVQHHHHSPERNEAPRRVSTRGKGAGYNFFWIGKPANDHRQAGVGLAIWTSYLCHIGKPPKGISERLMMMRIRFSGRTMPL